MMIFDGETRVITLEAPSLSSVELWSSWVDWLAMVENAKWDFALRSVGGDLLQGTTYIPPYIFLINGWKIRPMEQDHELNINGYIYSDDESNPIVPTLGAYNVQINRDTPMQAQLLTGFATEQQARLIISQVL